jgi:hypothetical protein
MKRGLEAEGESLWAPSPSEPPAKELTERNRPSSHSLPKKKGE